MKSKETVKLPLTDEQKKNGTKRSLSMLVFGLP